MNKRGFGLITIVIVAVIAGAVGAVFGSGVLGNVGLSPALRGSETGEVNAHECTRDDTCEVNSLELDGISFDESVFRLLNSCVVNSRLTSDRTLTGDSHCGEFEEFTCIGNYFSEVWNPEDSNFTLSNTLRTSCNRGWEGNSDSFYIQSICCSPPSN